ncbi:MAG TPA: DNA-binding protein [Propionibacteriaceae bacterium]|nr:DNA-binding protein [Propionibacteriaceae bacterium]
MNSTRLAAAVAAKTGLDPAVAADAARAVFDLIGTELAAGQKVNLAGFGSFEVRDRAARAGRNPQTGAPLVVPAHRAVIFRPSSALRVQVN